MYSEYPKISGISQIYGLSSLENREYGSIVLITQHPLFAEVGTNFPDKRRAVARSV
jgi:hypothetical protein